MAGGGIEGAVGAAGEALVADALVQATAPNARGRQVGGSCANCGTTLLGPHCHNCGQVADDMHRPFWALFKEGIEGLFSLDGRFFKTVPALLFQPGRVTKAYLDGARARYVPPFRLYLVSAVIFLLAVSLVTGDWTNVDPFEDEPTDIAALEEQERSFAQAAAEAEAAGDPTAEGLAAARDRVSEILDEAREAEASEDATQPEVARFLAREREKCRFRSDLLPEELGERCVALLADTERDGMGMDEGLRDLPIGFRRFIVHQADVVVDDPSRFLESINSWISRILIGLFPVYALILALMHFWKRRFFFYDHLIVSMHFHSFLFVLTTILILLGWIAPVWALCIVFVLWGHFYVYKVHRVVYGCGRFSSVLRTLVLDGIYFVVLLFVPIVLVISGFLTA